jgi:hypothetical protein
MLTTKYTKYMKVGICPDRLDTDLPRRGASTAG